MKVKHLNQILRDCDPNMEVILSTDAEGNRFETVGGATKTFYVREGKNEGYCPHPDDVLEMDEERRLSLKEVLLIWP